MQYTPSHEWLRKIDDDMWMMGITQHAVKELGEVVYIESLPIGSVIEKGQAVIVVESSKAAVDIYAPLNGVIIATNMNIIDINNAPEQTGWILQIRGMLDQDLLSKAAYEGLLHELS